MYAQTLVIAPEKRYQLDSTKLEHRVTNIVPDVLAHVAGRPLLIEVRVTHEVDSHKLKRIQNLNVSAIEIDLSGAPRNLLPEDLEELVVEAGPHKRWVHNVVAARKREQVLSEATVRPMIERDSHFTLTDARFQLEFGTENHMRMWWTTARGVSMHSKLQTAR